MKAQLEKIWKKLKSLATLSGSPYSIAMGAAVGIFWNFIPSLGVGPFLSVGLAKILKASGIAALTVNISTGFFIPLFYSLNLLVGRTIVNRNYVSTEEVSDTIQKSFQESLDVVETVAYEPTSFFSLDKLQDFSVEFFLGGFINACITAGLVYLILLSVLNYKNCLKKFKNKKEKKRALSN